MRKVTAFVTRGRGARAQLLLFDHPSAGVQIPAGTVEPGEEPEAAVLREVGEETGLTRVEIAGLLGTKRVTLPPDVCMISADAVPFSEPTVASPRAWRGLPRGVLASRTDARDGFTRVRYREHDVDSGDAIADVEGWVLDEVVVGAYERFFYHCITKEQTADSWDVPHESGMDAGATFRCRWVPLSDPPELVSGQDQWLDAYVDALRAST